MAKDNYEAAFKGDRKAAEDAAMNIQKKMMEFRREIDGPYKLQFSCCVLKRICQAISGNGVHYSIYCDVFENILVPNIDSKSNKANWSCYLDFVRYYHSLLCAKKRHVEMQRVYNWIANISNKFESEKDYEYILEIYFRHLITLTGHIDNINFKSDKVIAETVNNITLLFKEMLQKNHELNYIYKDLVSNIIPFLNPQKMRLLYTNLSKDILAMFDSMIMLLTEQRMPNIATKDSEALLMQYLEATMTFVHIDVVLHPVAQVFVLKFLKACLNFKPFQSDKAISYVLSLLYFFVKFVFAQNKTPSFTQNYIELCEKLQNFFNKSGEALKHKKWFMDVVVTMSLMLFQVDDNNLLIFKVLRKQMENSLAICVAHIGLIYSLIKLTPSISQTKLTSWKCCTSKRKHIALQLVQSTLKFYAAYMIDVSEKKTTNTENESEIIFTSIIQQGIELINSMACIVSTSNDIYCFNQRFSSLLSKVTTDSQAKMCISLAETLVKIKSKFSSQLWIMILRRLRSVAAVTKDSKLIAEFHAIYIGYLFKEKNIDADLQNQISAFYTTKNLGWDMCLFEILKMSKNSLKPALEAEEEQLLKTLEVKTIIKHGKANNALLQSVLKGIEPNSLEYVLIARQSKHVEAIKTLHKNYMKFKEKQNEDAGLNCMNYLILAHTVVVVVNENVENLKKVFVLSTKEYSENDLDELLLKEEIINVDILVEANLINTILEAVQLFAKFFKKDLRLKLTASEEKQIDWIAVLDDVSLLARTLQYRGYFENACEAWLLLYTIADTIGDRHNVLRAFAFLCEHAEFFENTKEIDLHCEVNKTKVIIFESMADIQALVPRRQNYLLLSLCQLAFYYARMGNNAYAEMLLNLAKAKHDIIPCRQGKFDIVLATIEAVKFRILWIDKKEAVRLDLRCIIRDIEVNLDHYRNLVFISSEDCLNYMILMYGLMLEITECTINRLCDNSFSSWLIGILKTALETASTLRVIQILTMWAYANLQMEYADRAQIKLIIAECFLKTKTVQEVKQKKTLSEYCAQKKVNRNELLALQVDPGIEAMRKMVQVNLSPIRKNTLNDLGFDLNIHRFHTSTYKNVISKNIDLEWTYVLIGCINLRLYFLIEKTEYLEEFYDFILGWRKNQEFSFMFKTFQKFELMTFHHYANFLRAQKKYDKALKYILTALDFYNGFEMNIDTIYKINLELQKQATKYEMSVFIPKETVCSAKLRRALEFKLSPENIKDQDKQGRKAVQTNKGSTFNPSEETAYVDLCTEDEHLKISNLINKQSKSQIEISPKEIKKNELEKNSNKQMVFLDSYQINEQSCSSYKEKACTEVQKVNNKNTLGLSKISRQENYASDFHKASNRHEIPVTIDLENIDDSENASSYMISKVKAEKQRVDRHKNPTKVRKNQIISNRKPLIALEVTPKLEVLHINANSSDENAKKDVKQICESLPLVAEKKSHCRPKNVIAEKTSDRIPVVRSKRNTRQQTKMLN